MLGTRLSRLKRGAGRAAVSLQHSQHQQSTFLKYKERPHETLVPSETAIDSVRYPLAFLFEDCMMEALVILASDGSTTRLKVVVILPVVVVQKQQ